MDHPPKLNVVNLLKNVLFSTAEKKPRPGDETFEARFGWGVQKSPGLPAAEEQIYSIAS